MPGAQEQNRCEWTLERIEPYVDDELSGAERIELERHLETCPACREDLASARAVVHELRALPELRCPDRMKVSEPAGSGEESMRAPFRGALQWVMHGLRPAMAVMLVVVVAAGAYVLVQWDTGRRARLASTSSYSARDLELAKIDAMTAFAYVNKYSRKTRKIVRDEVLNEGIVYPLERVITQSKRRAPRER